MLTTDVATLLENEELLSNWQSEPETIPKRQHGKTLRRPLVTRRRKLAPSTTDGRHRRCQKRNGF